MVGGTHTRKFPALDGRNLTEPRLTSSRYSARNGLRLYQCAVLLYYRRQGGDNTAFNAEVL
jgi:hypothetical protein